MPRFFHPELIETITLDPEESHHLVHVLRIGEGEEVEVIDGKGGLATAQVTQIKKGTAKLMLKKRLPKGALSPSFTLVQAVLRMPRLEWLVEKATELGVTRFLFYTARLSDKETLSEKQFEHLYRIAIAAMKQCGRLYLPSFELTPRLEDAKLEEPLFYADLDPALPPLLSKTLTAPLALCIGPEKGFHAEELTLLAKRGEGVRLHPWTLRAETAALCGASIIASNWLH